LFPSSAAQEVEVEALPHNWDGAGSSVHRGGARMWGDASHASGNFGGASIHRGGALPKGESHHSGGGWPRDQSSNGRQIDVEAGPNGGAPKAFRGESSRG